MAQDNSDIGFNFDSSASGVLTETRVEDNFIEEYLGRFSIFDQTNAVPKQNSFVPVSRSNSLKTEPQSLDVLDENTQQYDSNILSQNESSDQIKRLEQQVRDLQNQNLVQDGQLKDYEEQLAEKMSDLLQVQIERDALKASLETAESNKINFEVKFAEKESELKQFKDLVQKLSADAEEVQEVRKKLEAETKHRSKLEKENGRINSLLTEKTAALRKMTNSSKKIVATLLEFGSTLGEKGLLKPKEIRFLKAVEAGQLTDLSDYKKEIEEKDHGAKTENTEVDDCLNDPARFSSARTQCQDGEKENNTGKNSISSLCVKQPGCSNHKVSDVPDYLIKSPDSVIPGPFASSQQNDCRKNGLPSENQAVDPAPDFSVSHRRDHLVETACNFRFKPIPPSPGCLNDDYKPVRFSSARTPSQDDEKGNNIGNNNISSLCVKQPGCSNNKASDVPDYITKSPDSVIPGPLPSQPIDGRKNGPPSENQAADPAPDLSVSHRKDHSVETACNFRFKPILPSPSPFTTPSKAESVCSEDFMDVTDEDFAAMKKQVLMGGEQILPLSPIPPTPPPKKFPVKENRNGGLCTVPAIPSAKSSFAPKAMSGGNKPSTLFHQSSQGFEPSMEMDVSNREGFESLIPSTLNSSEILPPELCYVSSQKINKTLFITNVGGCDFDYIVNLNNGHSAFALTPSENGVLSPNTNHSSSPNRRLTPFQKVGERLQHVYSYYQSTEKHISSRTIEPSCITKTPFPQSDIAHKDVTKNVFDGSTPCTKALPHACADFASCDMSPVHVPPRNVDVCCSTITSNQQGENSVSSHCPKNDKQIAQDSGTPVIGKLPKTSVTVKRRIESVKNPEVLNALNEGTSVDEKSISMYGVTKPEKKRLKLESVKNHEALAALNVKPSVERKSISLSEEMQPEKKRRKQLLKETKPLPFSNGACITNSITKSSPPKNSPNTVLSSEPNSTAKKSDIFLPPLVHNTLKTTYIPQKDKSIVFSTEGDKDNMITHNSECSKVSEILEEKTPVKIKNVSEKEIKKPQSLKVESVGKKKISKNKKKKLKRKAQKKRKKYEPYATEVYVSETVKGLALMSADKNLSRPKAAENGISPTKHNSAIQHSSPISPSTEHFVLSNVNEFKYQPHKDFNSFNGTKTGFEGKVVSPPKSSLLLERDYFNKEKLPEEETDSSVSMNKLNFENGLKHISSNDQKQLSANEDIQITFVPKTNNKILSPDEIKVNSTFESNNVLPNEDMLLTLPKVPFQEKDIPDQIAKGLPTGAKNCSWISSSLLSPLKDNFAVEKKIELSKSLPDHELGSYSAVNTDGKISSKVEEHENGPEKNQLTIEPKVNGIYSLNGEKNILRTVVEENVSFSTNSAADNNHASIYVESQNGRLGEQPFSNESSSGEKGTQISAVSAVSKKNGLTKQQNIDQPNLNDSTNKKLGNSGPFLNGQNGQLDFLADDESDSDSALVIVEEPEQVCEDEPASTNPAQSCQNGTEGSRSEIISSPAITAKTTKKKKTKNNHQTKNEMKTKAKAVSEVPTEESNRALTITKAFEELEKIKFDESHSKLRIHTLVNALINPSNAPDTISLVFAVCDFLKDSRRNPFLSFSINHDPAALLPQLEKCLVTSLVEVEHKKKSHLSGLLASTVQTLHLLVLAKDSVSIYGLSAFCRVLTELYKCLKDERSAYKLCSDLLKMKHKFAPYLIASVVSVWPKVFELPDDATDIELMYLSAILYGINKKPKSLTDVQWKHSMLLVSRFLTPPAVVDVTEAVNNLIETLKTVLEEESFKEEFMLIDPLIIFSVHEDWDWTEEKIVLPFILESLADYAENRKNERAFILFCEIYSEIGLMAPMLDKPIELLRKYFDLPDAFGYVKHTAACSLLRLFLLKNQIIPGYLSQWIEENQTHLIKSSIEHLIRRRMMTDSSELSEEDIIPP